MKQQRGVVIVAAIFILVVLSALAAFVVSVSTNQQVGSALDLQAARTYQAARAGIEWGMYESLVEHAASANEVTTPSGRCPVDAGTVATPTPYSFQVPQTAAGYAPITVTLTCIRTFDTSSNVMVYRMFSTACNQPVAGWTATTAACPVACQTAHAWPIPPTT